LYCGWFSVATIRSPRASVFCVAWSSSEPNWENGLQLAVLGELEPQAAGHLPHRLRLAEPPTRDTEVPTLIAGRMPE
jgi:hypothetical protein